LIEEETEIAPTIDVVDGHWAGRQVQAMAVWERGASTH
jgi:hypothetical protein